MICLPLKKQEVVDQVVVEDHNGTQELVDKDIINRNRGARILSLLFCYIFIRRKNEISLGYYKSM